MDYWTFRFLVVALVLGCLLLAAWGDPPPPGRPPRLPVD